MALVLAGCAARKSPLVRYQRRLPGGLSIVAKPENSRDDWGSVHV